MFLCIRELSSTDLRLKSQGTGVNPSSNLAEITYPPLGGKSFTSHL